MARLLGQLLAGWRNSLWGRLRPWLVPGSMALWLAMFVGVIPLLHGNRDAVRLRLLGPDFRIKSEPNGKGIEITVVNRKIESIPAAMAELNSFESVRKLDLSGCNDLRGDKCLEPLKGMTEMKSLDLSRCAGLTGEKCLEPLKGMTEMKSLDLSGCTGLTGDKCLEPLKELQALDVLILEKNDPLVPAAWKLKGSLPKLEIIFVRTPY